MTAQCRRRLLTLAAHALTVERRNCAAVAVMHVRIVLRLARYRTTCAPAKPVALTFSCHANSNGIRYASSATPKTRTRQLMVVNAAARSGGTTESVRRPFNSWLCTVGPN